MDQETYGPTTSERLAGSWGQWKEAMSGFSRSLRVALPATVVSFDPQKQTVIVQPASRELAREGDALAFQDLPQLADVPILLPRAGGFTLTMPIKAGDECLVVFADHSIDAWYQAGGVANPAHARRHALADGFAILAPWNQQRTLGNYSAGSAQLRSDDGATVIDLAAGQVTITAQTVNVHATGTATVQGATVNVTGSSAVHISGNGSTQIEGRDFLTHKHAGVQSGGSVSGPVA